MKTDIDIIGFYRQEQRRIHTGLREAVQALTSDEWHFLLPGTGNHIAFTFLHCVRTEDNVFRFILRGRPPIWNAKKWYESLGLPERIQGTGLSTDEARHLIVNDPPLLLQYAEQVWQDSEIYLASITDGGVALANRIITVNPLGNMPALQVIGQVCISHFFLHLGEIYALLGAQGKTVISI